MPAPPPSSRRTTPPRRRRRRRRCPCTRHVRHRAAAAPSGVQLHQDVQLLPEAHRREGEAVGGAEQRGGDPEAERGGHDGHARRTKRRRPRRAPQGVGSHQLAALFRPGIPAARRVDVGSDDEGVLGRPLALAQRGGAARRARRRRAQPLAAAAQHERRRPRRFCAAGGPADLRRRPRVCAAAVRLVPVRRDRLRRDEVQVQEVLPLPRSADRTSSRARTIPTREGRRKPTAARPASSRGTRTSRPSTPSTPSRPEKETSECQ